MPLKVRNSLFGFESSFLSDLRAEEDILIGMTLIPSTLRLATYMTNTRTRIDN